MTLLSFISYTTACTLWPVSRHSSTPDPGVSQSNSPTFYADHWCFRATPNVPFQCGKAVSQPKNSPALQAGCRWYDKDIEKLRMATHHLCDLPEVWKKVHFPMYAICGVYEFFFCPVGLSLVWLMNTTMFQPCSQMHVSSVICGDIIIHVGVLTHKGVCPML